MIVGFQQVVCLLDSKLDNLGETGVELDRKVLSNMAILDPNGFSQVVKLALQ